MRCPICREELISLERRPFCSERCQRIDLAKWLGGDYRISGPPLENDQPQPTDLGDDEERSWH
jgi:endogenous inhibitor of DNA gyrase (YacG/DUF329 family)